MSKSTTPQPTRIALARASNDQLQRQLLVNAMTKGADNIKVLDVDVALENARHSDRLAELYARRSDLVQRRRAQMRELVRLEKAIAVNAAATKGN